MHQSQASNSTTRAKSANPRDAMTRSPLSNKANVSPDPQAKWDHKDSSEGQPSSHDSICDAAWISTSDVAKSPYQTPAAPLTPPSLRPVTRSSPVDPMDALGFDLESESPLSRLETPFLYGHGTELAPILEQRSIATLRTKGSLSTSDLSSLMHDAPGKQPAKATGKGERDGIHLDISDSLLQLKLGRQSPFSIDEHFPSTSGLALPVTGNESQKSEEREVKKTESGSDLDSERTISSPQLKRLVFSRPTIHVVDVHAYPIKPIYPVPERVATPPSIRLVKASARSGSSTRRPWSEGAGMGEGPFHASTRTMRTASASGAGVSSSSLYDDTDMPGFKFRPPRSGHGNLAAHPFMRQRTTTPSSPALINSLYVSDLAPAVVAGEESRGGGGLDDPYLAPPQYRGEPCRKCRHPSGEPWSLVSTIAGHGPGMRRGADWCSRCACRKVYRILCC